MDQLLFAFILSGAIAGFSFFAKLLSKSGSLATFVLAFLIFGLGGWKWTVPILTFFLLSSLLSKLWKKQKQRFEQTFEKTDKRDAIQVAANGGVGAIIIVLNEFFPGFSWYAVYLASIAAVTADTWATEIGVLSKKMPRSIVSWKSVPHGTSGGVSPLGTMGGFLGAAVITGVGMLFEPLSVATVLIVILTGGLGNIIDSVFGATLQASYMCKICGAKTERTQHCNTPASLISGFSFVRNDTVNFMSALSVAVVASLLLAMG